MKKILLLFLVLFTFQSLTFSQEVVEKIAKKAAKEIIKEISELPDTSKISIIFFKKDDQMAGNPATHLGVIFTKYLAKELKNEISDKKLNNKFLFPEGADKMLHEKMKEGFNKPDNVQSKDFWKDFLENNTPDFFITGNYRINGDYEEFDISFCEIQPDVYGYYKDELPRVVNKIKSFKIRNEVDRDIIRKLDMPLANINDSYTYLMSLVGSDVDFDMFLTDQDENKINSPNIIVGKDYNISIDLQKGGYVYAFFFDPSDQKNPYMYMLYPYDKSESNYMEKGKHTLPPGYTFTPEPPGDGEQVYIQVVVTQKKLDIDFSYKEDEAGNITVVFYPEQSKVFAEKLKKLDKSKISTNKLAFYRRLH